ncbi:hypothetical protein CRG98_026679 [Punica granatum]|uniref:BZIP domain-containing protein n=1 Tax=Punica granatum TaxID=22663 RepID=A0A2I0J9E0_PUNGR|nr:hypothetical protein CRG98_026679 [Punica granatum]
MEDGELDFSNQEVFSNPEAFSNSIGEVPSSSRSMDSFLDEIFKDAHACTHTHTCNPSGPDSSHTHTCYHVHTKIVPSSSEEKADDSAESSEKKKPAGKKRPLGNREAVRKYREKKKARAASLEDEVVRLRGLNQQLLRRLQGLAALEAENARLKCLLVDIRGRIEGEIGSFPYQKTANIGNSSMPLGSGAYMMNPCNVQCGNEVYCLHPDGKTGDGVGINGQLYGGCELDSQCLANQNNSNSGLKEVPGCGVAGMGNGTSNALGNGTSNVLSSGGGKKKKGDA